MITINKQVAVAVIFIVTVLHSCVIDPINDDLKIVNNSRNNYIGEYYDFYIDKTDSIKDKKEMIEKISNLYLLWDANNVNIHNYYRPENIHGYYFAKISGIESISTRGTSIPKYFRFYFINADTLFKNYQKGIPVDSFKSYEIKKYTKEELKKTNYQIIINE